MKAAQMNGQSGWGLTEGDLDEEIIRARVSSIEGIIVIEGKE